MSNALAVQTNEIQTRAGFTDEQVQLLKDTVCKGATNVELALFLEVCKSKRLDPFSKQIHAVKRPTKDGNNWKEVMSFQTGIDGFRLIAERSKEYAGQSAPLWCGDDGVWRDVWLSNKPPLAAKVSVHRHGFIEPMTRIAKYSEYVQTKSGGDPVKMWATMPANQLAKCAESAALRAAFPEELSGLYTHEEMEQSDNDAPPKKSRAEKVADAQAVAAERIAEMQKALPPAVHDAEFVEEQEPAPENPVEFGKMMASFKDIKPLIGEAEYYSILKANGFEKSNLIRPLSKARDIYKQMAARAKAVKARAVWMDQFAELATKMGEKAFYKSLGRHGYEKAEDIPSEQLARIHQEVSTDFTMGL